MSLWPWLTVRTRCALTLQLNMCATPYYHSRAHMYLFTWTPPRVGSAIQKALEPTANPTGQLMADGPGWLTFIQGENTKAVIRSALRRGDSFSTRTRLLFVQRERTKGLRASERTRLRAWQMRTCALNRKGMRVAHWRSKLFAQLQYRHAPRIMLLFLLFGSTVSCSEYI